MYPALASTIAGRSPSSGSFLIGWRKVMSLSISGRILAGLRCLPRKNSEKLGAGHVVSFEPRSDLFKIMERSVRNALDQYVSLYQMALADRAGPIELVWNEGSPAASYLATKGLNPGGRHETVPSIRMDDIEFPGPVRLIKSDAEGAEALLSPAGNGC